MVDTIDTPPFSCLTARKEEEMKKEESELVKFYKNIKLEIVHGNWGDERIISLGKLNDMAVLSYSWDENSGISLNLTGTIQIADLSEILKEAASSKSDSVRITISKVLSDSADTGIRERDSDVISLDGEEIQHVWLALKDLAA